MRPLPSEADRLAMREPPPGRAVMRQRWNHLLFLHWPIDAAEIASRLPDGLHVDTFAGQAWIGIVPFFMERVRPVGLPPVPGLSWFLELNVRTYVYDDEGRPGVWFFSLDCDQPIAVAIAKRFFHLPYEHAVMGAKTALVADDEQMTYRCRRREPGVAEATYAWSASRDATLAALGSLEWFLVERYLLFAADARGRLYRGRVHHAPYQINTAACPTWSTAPLAWDGLSVPQTPPASILSATAVDVRVFPLKGPP